MMSNQFKESSNDQGKLDPQIVESFNRMANMLSGAENPNQAIENFAKVNPMASQIMSICNGGNFKDVFFNECRRRGLDPVSIANQLHII